MFTARSIAAGLSVDFTSETLAFMLLARVLAETERRSPAAKLINVPAAPFIKILLSIRLAS
jgi:hypothetical protein